MVDQKQFEKDIDESLGTSGEWKEAATTYGVTWDFRVDKEVIGVLKGTHQANTKYGPKTVYDLEKQDGTPVSVWESAQISRALHDLPTGTEVKIVYQGKGESKGGNQVNLFKFYLKG